MKVLSIRHSLRASLLLFIVALLPNIAFAAASAGGGLPYEDPLAQLVNSVSGPVAFTLSVVGVVVAAGALVFGAEMNAFFRSLVLLILVISLLIAVVPFLAGFFGVGAQIAVIDPISVDPVSLADVVLNPQPLQVG